MRNQRVEMARIRWLTILLLGLAVSAASLATADADELGGARLLQAIVMVTAAIALLAVAGKRFGNRAEPPNWVGLAMGLLCVAPAVVEPLRRAIGWSGQPGEVLLFEGLRNLLLGLVVCCRWPRFWKLAGLASLFMMVTALSLGRGPLINVVAITYASAGFLWLVEIHWTAVPRLQLTTTRRTLLLPRSILAILAVAGTAGLLAATNPAAVQTILPGLVPTSGGTGEHDPWARDGVNDGEGMVKASHDPLSTGFTDSDFYLSSPEPSLYDVQQDQYSDPPKPKEIDRAVAISTQQITDPKDKPAHSSHAGREFSTVREHRKRSPPPRGVAAKALMYVSGRTPWHLRLSVYDRFDGVRWYEADDGRVSLPAALDESTNWLRFLRPDPLSCFADDDIHVLKIGDFTSPRVPTPAHVTGLRMENVNRLDFFAWVQSAVVTLAATRRVPGGTKIEIENRTIDPGALCSLNWEPVANDPTTASLNASIDPGVAMLARQWTQHLPRGWQQIQAIASGLRQGCILDPTSLAPASCTDTVENFVCRDRRGPDYQFASAAAVMLRELGYRVRVVSGFYARPERFDAQTRHTPVLAEDIHFWVEVWMPDGSWTTVETTPGYEIVGPYFSWSRRCTAALAGLRILLAEYRLFVATATVLACFAWRWRRPIADAYCTLRWRFMLCTATPDRAAIAVLRLLDRRAALGRNARPPGCTPRNWFLPAARAASCVPALEIVLDLADRTVHAPASMAFDDQNAASDIQAICRQVVLSLTLRRLGRPVEKSGLFVFAHDSLRFARDLVHAVLGRFVPRNSPLEFGETNP